MRSISLFYFVMRGQSWRFIRFGIVGASGAVVNMLLLYMLVRYGGWNPLVAATVATEVAILSNFALNDRWTFSDGRVATHWMHRAARYNAIALGGLAISLTVMKVLIQEFGVYYLGANFVAIAAATLWNYTGSIHLTWAVSRQKERSASARALATDS